MTKQILKTRQLNWTVISTVGLVVLGLVGLTYTQALKERNSIELQKNNQDIELQKMRLNQLQQVERDKAATEADVAEKMALDIQQKQAAEALEKDARLKDKCSKDAEALFYKKYNYGNDSYTSHYNKKLDKCFIQVSGIGTEYASVQLMDVSEKNAIALCNQSRTTSKVQVCIVGKTTCSSWDECTSLIRPLMND